MGTSEIEFFQKQIESNISKASQGGVVLTTFLDQQKLAILAQNKNSEIDILMDGGFLNAEHKRVLFKPKEIIHFDFKVKVYQILYNTRYLELHHRKVLGALLNLGIKRESIGDIIFLDDKVYFSCTKEISSYLEQSFTTISGVPIEIKEVKEQIEAIQKKKYELHIISSLRLDVILASAYHVSRADASTMILDGLVMLNHLECKNNSKMIKVNDIISVRHKGRFCLEEIEGSTRNDRIKAKLGFWI